MLYSNSVGETSPTGAVSDFFIKETVMFTRVLSVITDLKLMMLCIAVSQALAARPILLGNCD